MKFALIAVAGSIGMGLSLIADAVRPFSADDYAVFGCIVMLIGVIGTIGPEILEWYENGKDKSL